MTPYDLSYFFSGEGTEGEYVIHAPTDQVERQLFAQYPDQDAISRSSIMLNFDDYTESGNQPDVDQRPML